MKRTTDLVTIKEDEIMSAVRSLQLADCGGDGSDISHEFHVKIARLLEQILNGINGCATAQDVSKLLALVAELKNVSRARWCFLQWDELA